MGQGEPHHDNQPTPKHHSTHAALRLSSKWGGCSSEIVLQDKGSPGAAGLGDAPCAALHGPPRPVHHSGVIPLVRTANTAPTPGRVWVPQHLHHHITSHHPTPWMEIVKNGGHSVTQPTLGSLQQDAVHSQPTPCNTRESAAGHVLHGTMPSEGGGGGVVVGGMRKVAGKGDGEQSSPCVVSDQ